jgi:hypothetical protein
MAQQFKSLSDNDASSKHSYKFSGVLAKSVIKNHVYLFFFHLGVLGPLAVTIRINIEL